MSFNFSSTPSFGSPATTAPTFGFGSNTSTAAKPSGFGTTNFSFGGATSAPATGFGLGTAGTAASASPFGGFTSFGSSTTSTAPTFGGFGSTAPTSTTFSGFGAPTSTTSTGFNFGGFGTTTATTSAPTLFSGFGQPQQTGTTFGKPTFGATTPSSGLSSFGLGTGLGQVQPQQAQPNQLSEADLVAHSIYNCCIYGDERDQINAKWNLLQACWGTGKGYYHPQKPPVEYTPRNQFCKFKAIVYSVKSTVEPKDGFVVLQINENDQVLRSKQDELKVRLHSILGSRQNIFVYVDSIRPLSSSNEKTGASAIFIYVEEKQQSGPTKRISSNDLCSYLMQATQKHQLQQIGVVQAYPYICVDKEAEMEYLRTPPAGIDPTLWRQAQSDNPDPSKFIPVPLLGFSEAHWRYKCQEEETRRHQAFLDQAADQINKLKGQNDESRLKINECKIKVTDLEHRILKLMVKRQITRNDGVSLQPEEEVLRSQLDTTQAQLNSPQLSGRLSEMLTQARLHRQEASQHDPDAYNMSRDMQQEIQQFLAMQQSGMKRLIDTMQSDMMDLTKIESELKKKSVL